MAAATFLMSFSLPSPMATPLKEGEGPLLSIPLLSSLQAPMYYVLHRRITMPYSWHRLPSLRRSWQNRMSHRNRKSTSSFFLLFRVPTARGPCSRVMPWPVAQCDVFADAILKFCQGTLCFKLAKLKPWADQDPFWLESGRERDIVDSVSASFFWWETFVTTIRQKLQDALF